MRIAHTLVAVLALIFTASLIAHEESQAEVEHYQLDLKLMGAYFEPDRLELSSYNPAIRTALSLHKPDGLSFGSAYTRALKDAEEGEGVNQGLELWVAQEFEAIGLEFEAEAKVVHRDRVLGQNVDFGELSLLAQKKLFWSDTDYVAPFLEASVIMPFRATEEFDDRLITRAGAKGHLQIEDGIAFEAGASFAHTTVGVPEFPGESIKWRHYNFQILWGNEHDRVQIILPQWDRIIISDHDVEEDIWSAEMVWRF